MKATYKWDTEGLLSFHSPFYNVIEEQAFDIHVYVQKKHFSGILVFKKLEEMYRFSMVTKTGSRLFDFSTDGQVVVKHAIHPELDKKIILEFLKNDFYLLFHSCVVEIEKLDPKRSNEAIYLDCRDDQHYIHYHYDAIEQPSLIGVGNGCRPKYWAEFAQYENGLPSKIKFNHRSLINLRLELTALALGNTE